jgi:hypothetical protein
MKLEAMATVAGLLRAHPATTALMMAPTAVYGNGGLEETGSVRSEG